MSIKNRLLQAFKGNKVFCMNDAYNVCDDMPKDSVRARIYENLGVCFRRISRNVYMTEDSSCIVLDGDGRDLKDCIEDESLDCIITDHPYLDTKSNSGGNKNFAQYECFKYTIDDFKEKYRVLKKGCFLVEMVASENESNYEYLYQIKKNAEAAGFQYYAKIPWVKGTFVANTGRSAKNSEDILIFSKGKARPLRPDVQRTKKYGTPQFMSGANGMLPTCFNVQPVAKKEQIAQSEKPSELVEMLLDYFTLPNELVLDQFAGSGVVGEACIKKSRLAILIEKDIEKVKRIAQRLSATVVKRTEISSETATETVDIKPYSIELTSSGQMSFAI